MSDFGQHGLIGTLQRLRDNPGLEKALETLARERPVALILPCHAGDLKRPALEAILDALSRAAFISEVLVPVNGVDAGGLDEAKAFFARRLRRPHRLIRGDVPAENPLFAVPGFAPGKGANVWLATGLLARENRAACLLFADADVTTFRLEMLARLAFAVAHPELQYAFAKAYYPRVQEGEDGRLYGRVSRLFLAPLLQALVRAGGHLPLLDFLRSFRYPLAGECAMTLALAASLPMAGGWGLEAGMLCDVFRRVEPRRVCQVDSGGAYDHKHQPLGEGGTGLSGMCGAIARTLFAHLAEEGMRLGALREAVLESYRREAAEALRRSAAVARINGLGFDEPQERRAAAVFEAALAGAFESPALPPLPPWQSAPASWSEAVARLVV